MDDELEEFFESGFEPEAAEDEEEVPYEETIEGAARFEWRNSRGCY